MTKPTGRPPKPLKDRLNDATNKTPGCWLWTGGKFATGYGAICLPGGKTVVAHRVAYEQWVGPIPKGKEIHHTCHCRLCVNPEHLKPVSRREHMAAHTKERSHCRNGHAYYPDNFYVVQGRSGPTKSCKICDKASSRARRIAFRQKTPRKPHRNAAKTHCKRGHEFTAENTRITTTGSRQCRACWRILQDRWKAKHPARPRGTPKERCKHGHEMTKANTYTYRGRRSCRACILARIHKSRAVRKTSINTASKSGLDSANHPVQIESNISQD